MAPSIARATVATPRINRELGRPRMAKATLETRTFSEKRENYGQILRRASELAGLNRNETADALGVDPARISRWWAGTETAQTCLYTEHPRFSSAYLRALAEREPTARIRMVIDIDERASA